MTGQQILKIIFFLQKNEDMLGFLFFILGEPVPIDNVIPICNVLSHLFIATDRNKEGKVQRIQLLRLLESLHHKNALMFNQVICPRQEEASWIDYETVKRMINEYPYMLEPAFRLQTTLRRKIMGDKFWKRKQTQLLNVHRESKRRQEELKPTQERNGKMRAEDGGSVKQSSFLSLWLSRVKNNHS